MLSIRSIEQKEKTIAAGLRKKLTLLALELGVEENWSLDSVPVVHVVWRRLKIPDKLPGVGIQGHDGASEEIVAGAPLACEHGIGIARAPIQQVELRVIRSGHPRHAASVEDGVGVVGPRFRARLAGVRIGVPAPLDRSGLRIQGLKETPNIRNIPGHADDHVIAYNQRRHCREVTELWIGELDDPANAAILGIETDQMRVGRSKVEPILVHAQSAIADVVAFGST